MPPCIWVAVFVLEPKAGFWYLQPFKEAVVSNMSIQGLNHSRAVGSTLAKVSEEVTNTSVTVEVEQEPNAALLSKVYNSILAQLEVI